MEYHRAFSIDQQGLCHDVPAANKLNFNIDTYCVVTIGVWYALLDITQGIFGR